jgi:UTP-glucose-1-phosphate uridylyltransferase
VTEFAEKPTLDYARSSLRVPGLHPDEYLTVFGQYIIKPKIFDYLQEHIENNIRESGEFQLTSALDRLRQEDGFLGLVMEGQRFDIGLPDYYLETLQNFGNKITTKAICRLPSGIARFDFMPEGDIFFPHFQHGHFPFLFRRENPINPS